MSEELFMAIGEIEDELVDEAYSYHQRKAPMKLFGRFSRAACILIVAMGVMTANNYFKKIEKPKSFQSYSTQMQQTKEDNSQFRVVEEKNEAMANVAKTDDDAKPKEVAESGEIKDTAEIEKTEEIKYKTESAAVQESAVLEVSENAEDNEVNFDAALPESSADKATGVKENIGSGGGGGASGGASLNTSSSAAADVFGEFDYITDLCGKINRAVMRGELSFVKKAEVSEDGKIYVTVTIDDENELNRVRELDTRGSSIVFIRE